MALNYQKLHGGGIFIKWHLITRRSFMGEVSSLQGTNYQEKLQGGRYLHYKALNYSKKLHGGGIFIIRHLITRRSFMGEVEALLCKAYTSYKISMVVLRTGHLLACL